MHNKVKMLIMDVDGTLTDGHIYMGNDGEFLKVFNVKDGYGIRNILSEHRITPAIITGRKSIILEKRCEELGIDVLYQGISDKKSLLLTLIKELSLNLEEIAYIGDDLNDLECIEICGVTGCPADSADGIKKAVDYVCKRNGGGGAVREFIEYIVNLKG